MTYSESEKQTLRDIARKSIEHGLAHGTLLPIHSSDYPPTLREKRATFVTLHKYKNLRGCIGILDAVSQLVEDVSEHAFAAAFRDPRFPQVTHDEIPHLEISISILSPSEPIAFLSEADLMEKIRPGVDGLILKIGLQRATFLPSVWEQVASVHEFLTHLKLKAGLPADFWSDKIEILRYTTESF